MLEVGGAEVEKFLSLMDYHLKSDYEPVSDYTLSYMGYPLSGYPIDEAAIYQLRPKAIAFDFDYTLTAEDSPLGFVAYLNWLAWYNSKIDRNYADIMSVMKEFKPSNLVEPAEKMGKKFRECDLRKIEHDESCLNARNEIKLIYNCVPTFSDLDAMLDTPAIISGSPNDVVSLIAVNDLGFDPSRLAEQVRGSTFEFRDDRFVSLYPVLYENKTSFADYFVKEITGIRNGMRIVVGDDPSDSFMIRSVVNPFIYLGREGFEDIPAELKVYCYEAGKNLRRIIKPLKRYERGLAMYFGFDEEGRQRILRAALDMKKTFGSIMGHNKKNGDVSKKKERLLAELNNYMDLSDGLTSKFFSGIEKAIQETEKAKTDEEIAVCTKALWAKMRLYSPEMGLRRVI